MNSASFPSSAWSRSGPTVPLAFASASVWQLPHGGWAVASKISLPAAGSPVALPLVSVGAVVSVGVDSVGVDSVAAGSVSVAPLSPAADST
jgi:hypothetical protein